MNLKLLFCVIVILVGSVETRTSRRKKTCTTCSLAQKSICEHGQCEIEKDCSAFGCICEKGWTGDMCNEECKRNCTRGDCYIIENEEHCACPEGYTSDSNCTEREPNGKHNILSFYIKSNMSKIKKKHLKFFVGEFNNSSRTAQKISVFIEMFTLYKSRGAFDKYLQNKRDSFMRIFGGR